MDLGIQRAIKNVCIEINTSGVDPGDVIGEGIQNVFAGADPEVIRECQNLNMGVKGRVFKMSTQKILSGPDPEIVKICI